MREARGRGVITKRFVCYLIMLSNTARCDELGTFDTSGAVSLFVASAASSKGREGTAYGLVMASQAVAGEVSGLVSVLAIRILSLGSPKTGRSWSKLPLFLWFCSCTKIFCGILAMVVWKCAMRKRRRSSSSDHLTDEVEPLI